MVQMKSRQSPLLKQSKKKKIIRDTSSFYIQNASFSVEYLETDNVNRKGDKTREYPYVMCNKDFLLLAINICGLMTFVYSVSNKRKKVIIIKK